MAYTYAIDCTPMTRKICIVLLRAPVYLFEFRLFFTVFRPNAIKYNFQKWISVEIAIVNETNFVVKLFPQRRSNYIRVYFSKILRIERRKGKILSRKIRIPFSALRCGTSPNPSPVKYLQFTRRSLFVTRVYSIPVFSLNNLRPDHHRYRWHARDNLNSSSRFPCRTCKFVVKRLARAFT